MEFAEGWASKKRQSGWNKGYMQSTANQGSSDTHHTPVICSAQMEDVVFSNHSKCKEVQFTLLSLEQHDLALM